MIKPTQIEEWIHEAEERPASTPLIIREIARRMAELADYNEVLLSENIALRSGERVKEYEDRISSLEYQLDMLKRHVGGLEIPVQTDAHSLLVYDERGRVIRLEFSRDELSSEGILGNIPLIEGASNSLRLLVTDPQEELLFVFDSGRAVNLPVAAVPLVEAEHVDWSQAYVQETRGSEALAFILPIARMALYDYCAQVSRRGFVKKIREKFMESCIASANVGTGVVQVADRTYWMVFCSDGDLLVLVSKEGSLIALPIDGIAYTIEESIRLGMMDHIVSAFTVKEGQSFLAVTQQGKVFHREADWLEPANSLKAQGRSILSKARLESGTRILAAAAVSEGDWGITLTSSGTISLCRIAEAAGSGSVLVAGSDAKVAAFIVFQLSPGKDGAEEKHKGPPETRP